MYIPKPSATSKTQHIINFKRGTTGSDLEFFFSYNICPIKVKVQNLY